MDTVTLLSVAITVSFFSGILMGYGSGFRRGVLKVFRDLNTWDASATDRFLSWHRQIVAEMFALKK